mgnify:CR=1 FL=1
MVTIYFVHKNGKQTEVKVPIGYTIMEAARTYAEPSIDEIPADCGGCNSCGTCHINIKEDIDKVGMVEYDSLENEFCLLYTSPSPRDLSTSRMPSSA